MDKKYTSKNISKQMDILREIEDAIVEGEKDLAPNLVKNAIASNLNLDDLTMTMGNAMNRVGKKFEKGEYFLPEMMLSALTFKACFDFLKPLIEEKVKRLGGSSGKIIFGTVRYDVHDVGKNLVITALTAAGFEVYDLGVDVPQEKFIEEAEKVNADIIALSALLSSTKVQLERFIDFLKENKLRGKYKVLVGGAPVSSSYADKIGADGYAEDAFKAVEKATKLMGR